MTELEITLLNRIASLLAQVGQKGNCKGCGAGILWVAHRNGKTVPYDASSETIGTNHFVTCPEREQFRKKAK